MSTYLYSVIKYYDDPIKDEAKNIGVIIVDKEKNKMVSKIATNMALKIGYQNKQNDHILIDFFLNSIKENSYSSRDQQELIFDTNINYEEKLEEMSINSRERLSKIQLSNIAVGVSEDIQSEISRLYSYYVFPIRERHILPQHRFKTEMKAIFRKEKIIGKNAFCTNAKISGSKSKVEHKFDLSYKNGKQYIVEIFDLDNLLLKDASESAFKFDDCLNGIGKRNLIPISIVKNYHSQQANECVRILESYSKLKVYSKSTRPQIIKEFNKIIGQ